MDKVASGARREISFDFEGEDSTLVPYEVGKHGSVVAGTSTNVHDYLAGLRRARSHAPCV